MINHHPGYLLIHTVINLTHIQITTTTASCTQTIETVEWMQSIRPLLWWSMLLQGYGDRSANRRRENKGLNRIVYCDAICIVSNKISMPKKEVILMP